MDYDKFKLAPREENEEPKTPAEQRAREELERERKATERYKKQYFEYYDDVKINHREDW